MYAIATATVLLIQDLSNQKRWSLTQKTSVTGASSVLALCTKVLHAM